MPFLLYCLFDWYSFFYCLFSVLSMFIRSFQMYIQVYEDIFMWCKLLELVVSCVTPGMYGNYPFSFML